MKYIEDYTGVLSDEELKNAFLEYEEWRVTGILKDGIMRDLNKKYKSETGVNLRIDGVIEPLLYEIAKRYYGMKG